MPGIEPSDRYDRLVRLAYRDALEPRPWQNFVGELATTLGSRDASLHIFTKHGYRSRMLVTNDSAPHLTDSYIDSMMAEYFLKKLPAQRPMTLEDFGVVRSFRGSLLFKRYLAPFGITHILTQDVYEDSDIVVRLSADRERQQGDFGETEKRLLQSITPHVRQALDIRSRFKDVDGIAGQYQDLLARVGVGCLVIGPRWEVLRINETATRALQGDHGFATQRGYLRLRNTPQLKSLRLAIDAAVQAHLSGMVAQPSVAVAVPSAHGGADLKMVVKPLPSGRGPCSELTPAALLLLLNDGAGDTEDIDADLLASLYKLTRSEARVGVLLTKGYTLKEAAEALHVSINTVKTHQHRIYDKLGLNRRSQMVNLLSRSLISLA